jgi:hypothetical protein
MRTTVTLDPDVAGLVRQRMAERGIGFKEALNEAVRAGLAPRTRRRFRQRTFPMGFRPEIRYDKALQIAAELEDQEILRKLAQGK